MPTAAIARDEATPMPIRIIVFVVSMESASADRVTELSSIDPYFLKPSSFATVIVTITVSYSLVLVYNAGWKEGQSDEQDTYIINR